MLLLRLSTGLVLTCTITGFASAQRPSLRAQMVVLPGAQMRDVVSVRIAVRMSAGWHIGAASGRAGGMPTALDWHLPPGWRIREEQWPNPITIVVGRDTTLVYDVPFTVDVSLVRAAKIASGKVESVLTYGICRDVCIPGRLRLSTEVH